MISLSPIYAAILWIGYRLLKASIDRLGNRISAWLFPDERPVTYRLALFLTRLAALVTPKQQLGWLVGMGFQHDAWIKGRKIPTRTPTGRLSLKNNSPYMLNCISTVPGFYAHPLLARNAIPAKGRLGATRALEGIADIEWIIKADMTVSDPIHLVFPLLIEAIGLRIRNFIIRINWLAVACRRMPTVVTGLLFRTAVWAAVCIHCISTLSIIWASYSRAGIDGSPALMLIQKYLKHPYLWVGRRTTSGFLRHLWRTADHTRSPYNKMRAVDFDLALSESESSNPYKALLIEAAKAMHQGNHDLAANLRDEISELASEKIPYDLRDGRTKFPALPHFFTGYSGTRIDGNETSQLLGL